MSRKIPPVFMTPEEKQKMIDEAFALGRQFDVAYGELGDKEMKQVDDDIEDFRIKYGVKINVQP